MASHLGTQLEDRPLFPTRLVALRFALPNIWLRLR
jgi:hypothetical protein